MGNRYRARVFKHYEKEPLWRKLEVTSEQLEAELVAPADEFSSGNALYFREEVYSPNDKPLALAVARGSAAGEQGWVSGGA